MLQRTSWNWMHALLWASALVLGMFVYAFVKVWAPHFTAGAPNLAAAGDSLSPFAALFSALALFAAFVSLALQTRELRATREEMSAQREEMREQKKEMVLQRTVLNQQARAADAQAIAARVQVVSAEAEFIARFAAESLALATSVPPQGGNGGGICQLFQLKAIPRPPLFCTDDNVFEKARVVEKLLLETRTYAVNDRIADVREHVGQVARAIVEYEKVARDWCTASVQIAHGKSDPPTSEDSDKARLSTHSS